MTNVIFTPYGEESEETGLIYLLSHYLAERRQNFIQLVCNGAFTVCARDRISDWNRGLLHCANCSAEQRLYGALANLDSYSLSRFLSAEQIAETQRFILSLDRDDLTTASFEGIPLFTLCLPSFKARFGREKPHFLNRNHERILREMFLSSARMVRAVERLMGAFKVSRVFLTGGSDFLTSIFIRSVERAAIDTVIFRWNSATRSVSVIRSRSNESVDVPYVREAQTMLQLPVEKWSAPSLSAVRQVSEFLEFENRQSFQVS